MATDIDITSLLHLLNIFIFMAVNVFVNESVCVCVCVCVCRIISVSLVTFSEVIDYHDEAREGNFLKCCFMGNPITSCV